MTEAASRKKWPRVAVRIAAALVLLAALALIRISAMILSPSTGSPTEVDAVILLAGGEGERLSRALEVLNDQANAVLAISTGNRQWEGWSEIEPLCEGLTKLEVICVTAEPDSTAGEALAMSALAEERGWRSLAVVTSDYHLHRATLRFRQCFDGEVVPVAAKSTRRLSLIVHEVLGTIEATALDRSCLR